MRYDYPNLKLLRMLRHTTQEELAKVLGITRPQYHLYESGKREIPVHILIKIAEYYRMSIDDILNGYDESYDNLMQLKLHFSPGKECQWEVSTGKNYKLLSEEEKIKISDKAFEICEMVRKQDVPATNKKEG